LTSSDSVAQVASTENASGSLRRNALGGAFRRNGRAGRHLLADADAAGAGAIHEGSVYGEADPARRRAVGRDHGWLKLSEQARLSVGERLRVPPNHACAVVDNFEEMTVRRDGEPVAQWVTAARGRVR
jgi:D-serine deaminase-like pyridoxal phosphate-dependent protein